MKKKALYFFQYLPPWKIDVFNGMAREYDLTVVFFDIDRKGFTYDRDDLLHRLNGVGVEVLSGGLSILGHYFRPGIRKLLRKYSPEVVFVHEFSPVTGELLLRRSSFGYRLIVTTSDNLSMAQGFHGFIRMVRNWVFRRVDGAIFYSNAVQDYYRKCFPSLNSRVCPNIQKAETLLRYRADFPSIIPKLKDRYGIGSEKLMLFIGRLAPVKALDLLLDAFAGVRNDGWKLVLVGEGECLDALQEQTRRLGLVDSVIFAGFHFGAELYAWYDLASFFIFPSHHETFGAVVNEALVFGCPVVASNHIGALDFLDNDNSIVFTPEDPEEFRRTLTIAMERFTGVVDGGRDSLMRRSFEQYLDAYFDIVK